MLLCFCVCFVNSFFAFAQPVNDNCSGAISLTLGTPLVTTNVAATNSTTLPNPNCNFTASDKDVWYTFMTPATESVVKISTIAGTLTDSGIGLYSGTCAGLTLVACDDNAGAGAMSYMETAYLTPSTIYFVRVWGKTANTGTFTLQVDGATPVTGTHRSSSSNAWNLSATWQRFGGITWAGATGTPLATDPTYVKDSVWFNITGTRSAKTVVQNSGILNIVGSLTVGTGNNVVVYGKAYLPGTINASSGKVLIEDDASFIPVATTFPHSEIIFRPGSNVFLNTNLAKNALITGTTDSLGNVICNGGSNTLGSGTSGVMQLAGSFVMFGGNFTACVDSATTINMVFTNGFQLYSGTPTFKMLDYGALPTVKNNASKVKIQCSAVQILAGSFSGISGTSIAQDSVIVNTGDFTKSGGNFDFNSSGANTVCKMSVVGNLTHTNGNLHAIGSGKSVINMAGSALKTIESVGDSLLSNKLQIIFQKDCQVAFGKTFLYNIGGLGSTLPNSGKLLVNGAFNTNTRCNFDVTVNSGGRFKNRYDGTHVMDTLNLQNNSVYEHAQAAIVVSAPIPGIKRIYNATSTVKIYNWNGVFGYWDDNFGNLEFRMSSSAFSGTLSMGTPLSQTCAIQGNLFVSMPAGATFAITDKINTKLTVGGNFTVAAPSTFIFNTQGSVISSCQITVEGDIDVQTGSFWDFPSSDKLKVRCGTLGSGGTINVAFNNTFLDGSECRLKVESHPLKTVNLSGLSAYNCTSLVVRNNMILGSDFTTNDTLYLINGVVRTGSNILTISNGGAIVRTNGHIAGKLAKEFAPSTSAVTFNFPVGDTLSTNYTPAKLTFEPDGSTNAVVNGGRMIASTTSQPHPNLFVPANAMKRYWNIKNENTNVTFGKYRLELAYLASDFPGGSFVEDGGGSCITPTTTECNMIIGKYSDGTNKTQGTGTWSCPSVGARTSGSSTDGGLIEIFNVSDFSDFAIAKDCGSVSVKDLTTPMVTATHIYPNPVQDNLHLTLNAVRPTQVQVVLVDMMGKTVFSEWVTVQHAMPYDIQTEHLTSGAYLLYVQYPQQVSEAHKIIKY